METVHGVISAGRRILATLLLLPAALDATPRTPGDQVGLFALEVSAPPNSDQIIFDFKVRNMTGILVPNVSAPFINTTASVDTYCPSFTIPSPKPEVGGDTVLPERFGFSVGTPRTVAAGDLNHTIISLTSVNPSHVNSLIGQLTDEIGTRNQLLNQFSAQAQHAMWAIGSALLPIPLDWESLFAKLLELWVPGSDITLALIDVGVTAVAMQNVLGSLHVLQPRIDALAERAELDALDVWLPYGNAQLTGFIPEIPDPGIVSSLPVGAMGAVPSGNTSTINVVSDTGPTLVLLGGAAFILLAIERHCRSRTSTLSADEREASREQFGDRV